MSAISLKEFAKLQEASLFRAANYVACWWCRNAEHREKCLYLIKDLVPVGKKWSCKDHYEEARAEFERLRGLGVL